MKRICAAAAFLVVCSSAARPAVAKDDAPPEAIDCATMDCAAVLPDAARFEPVEGEPYVVATNAEGETVGWVALSTQLVDIKAYSSKPLVTLIGLDDEGVIRGARVVHHSEPILLVGIPEQALHDFVDLHVGHAATRRIVVGRAPEGSDAITIDAISGATVTALAQTRTIMEASRNLGSLVGVVDTASLSQGHFVQRDEVWSWPRMVDEGVFGRLTVSAEEMGVSDGEGPFMDIWFTLADAPHVGRALLGDNGYAFHEKKLEAGEHLLVVLGNGLSSFKGSAFVRGGLFDRVRVEQDLRELMFRDTDYTNLGRVQAEGAPRFKEGAIFITRDGRLDPGAPFSLVFLGSRYDRRGAYSRDFREFEAEHRLPDSVYVVDVAGDEPLWRQALRNRWVDVLLLGVFLLFVAGLFVARRWTTADPKRLARLHLGVMAVSFLMAGVYMRAQPSVTQMLTLVDTVDNGWRWELFLSDPLLFVSWIFIFVVSLVWGRGVFCGWVCPYGALTEILHRIRAKLGLRGFELPDRVHYVLRYLRYAVFAVLVATFLWSSVLGETLAEVEPFKSTFMVPAWNRHWGLFAWWALLLGLSLFMYRPFCRYVCPMGAGLALLGSVRRSGPRRREFCSKCTICARGCEPKAIRDDGTIDPRECLSCMECEATYRDEATCPPLVGIARLRRREPLGEHDRRRLRVLQEDAKDV